MEPCSWGWRRRSGWSDLLNFRWLSSSVSRDFHQLVVGNKFFNFFVANLEAELDHAGSEL
jgi:hypothetical protein